MQKSAKDCAEEMLRRGGDEARAIRYAAGYGARKALDDPETVRRIGEQAAARERRQPVKARKD
jgi:hypothetical protein